MTSPAKDALNTAIRDIGRTCGRQHVLGYNIASLIVVPLSELLDALALNEYADDNQLLDRTRTVLGRHLITLQDAALALAPYLPAKHTLRKQITFLRVAEKEGKLAQPAIDEAVYPLSYTRNDALFEWRIGQSGQALQKALLKKSVLPIRIFDTVTGLVSRDDVVDFATLKRLLHPDDMAALGAAINSDTVEFVRVNDCVYLHMTSLVSAFFYPPPSGRMPDPFEEEEEDEIDSGNMLTVCHSISYSIDIKKKQVY